MDFTPHPRSDWTDGPHAARGLLPVPVTVLAVIDAPFLPTGRKRLDAWVEATSLADLFNYVVTPAGVFTWAGDAVSESAATYGPVITVGLTGDFDKLVNKFRKLVFWLKETGRVNYEVRIVGSHERLGELTDPWVEREQTSPVPDEYTGKAVPHYVGDPALNKFVISDYGLLLGDPEK